jgi:hypothetical protein
MERVVHVMERVVYIMEGVVCVTAPLYCRCIFQSSYLNFYFI